MPIGKKSIAHFKDEKVLRSYSGVGDYWKFSQTSEIAEILIQLFLKDEYQKFIYFIRIFIVPLFKNHV